MFVRKEMYRTAVDIKRMKSDILGVVAQIKGERFAWLSGQMSPRCLDSCYKWNNECEFMPVCRGETTLDNTELYEKKEERSK